MSMAERKIMTRAVKNPVKRKLTRAEKKEIAAVIQAAKGDGKPHTAQQTIPYLQMYPDGICRVTEKKYSKSLVFEDINYQLAQADAYQLAEYLKVAPAEYDVFYIFVFTVLVTLSSTTYPSISIEGKQIEILKSLPITAKYIIKSKILLHLSVSGPIILVLNTVMAFYLHWSLEKVMLGYAMPFLYSLFIGIIGCLINIFFPNFEWENITHIIKQSLPAILSALIGTLSTCGTWIILIGWNGRQDVSLMRTANTRYATN